MSLFPMLLVENGVKILNVLVVHGWESKISPQLVQQIFGLLNFIVGQVPGEQAKREVPEETVVESFRTLTALLRVAGPSAAASGVTEPDALPTLGHGITVMLEGATSGVSDTVQKEALRCLQSVYTSLKDQAALASFLPGTVSSLTKILSTPARYKRLVLVRCIETASLVLTRVLGDIHTRGILAAMDDPEAVQQDKDKLLSPAWLNATKGQVKLALTRIMKLRTHESSEVREALQDLCLKLLDECHRTLQDCAPFIVETAMVLYEQDAISLSLTNLPSMAQIYPELAKEVQNTLYKWTSSLSRIMQGADEDAKKRALHDLSKGIHLTSELAFESSTLQEMLANALVDSVTVFMNESKPESNIYSADVELTGGNGSLVLASGQRQYQPVLLNHQSQRDSRHEMLDLIKSVDSSSQSSKLSADLLEQARAAAGTTRQVAAFWLCFELVKAANDKDGQFSDFLNIEGLGLSDDADHVLDELYYASLEILDSRTENTLTDWRLEAIALEVTAYAAKKQGESFRPELIDVLFPVVSFMGSENASLRQHAIITLGELAKACQYGSVSELIVANVDYMVNSVALRLNTLDISPASTQVLTMMIRLAGPRLVPFLDDVVDSIFAALENYHGYPAFVESLFTVLNELVSQAVKSNTLLLEGQKPGGPDHKKVSPQVEGLDDLVDFLEKRKERQERDKKEAETGELGPGHPQVPWKETSGDDGEEEEGDAQPPPEPEKPPNSPTYQLLLRITNLTQHYLTSPTPRLRRSLLGLLTTASPALAADEDAFLPLVHATWPVVVARLKDEEAYVAIEACHALAGLCAAAGDFLSSRFRTEWVEGLKDWCGKAKRAASSSSASSSGPRKGTAPSHAGAAEGAADLLIPTANGNVVKADKKKNKPSQTISYGGLGQHSSPVKLWEATVKLLTAMVSHVRLPDEIFDDILDLLAEALEKDGEVREALETINADAVWLVRYQRGEVEEMMTTPVMEGFTFVPMIST